MHIFIERATNRFIVSFNEEVIETSVNLHAPHIGRDGDSPELIQNMRLAIKKIVAHVESILVQELARIARINPEFDTTSETFQDEYEKIYGTENEMKEEILT